MRSAVILAGGSSSRLGIEKSLLLFDEKPLICWTVEKLARAVDEVIVVARDESHARHLGELLEKSDYETPSITWDSVSGFGPVAGLDAGMRCATGKSAFATGCDLPFLNLDIIDLLFELANEREGYDAAVPVQPNGFFEPLHSVYDRKKMLFACRKAVENGERRIHVPLQELSVRRISVDLLRSIDAELLTFFNLNTPQDLEEARRLWPIVHAKIKA
jgi:molybdenum cofactor guanylyltransferase